MGTTLASQLLVIQVSCYCYHYFQLHHQLSVMCFSVIFTTIICSYILLSFFSEAHPDVIGSDGVTNPEGYQNDLAYLKSKVLLLN